jgi:hypothetical protein
VCFNPKIDIYSQEQGVHDIGTLNLFREEFENPEITWQCLDIVSQPFIRFKNALSITSIISL